MTKGMSQWQAGSDLYDKAISGSPIPCVQHDGGKKKHSNYSTDTRHPNKCSMAFLLHSGRRRTHSRCIYNVVDACFANSLPTMVFFKFIP